MFTVIPLKMTLTGLYFVHVPVSDYIQHDMYSCACVCIMCVEFFYVYTWGVFFCCW